MTTKYVFSTLNGVVNTRESISNDVFILPEKVKMLSDFVRKCGALFGLVDFSNRGNYRDERLFYNRAFKLLGMPQGVSEFFTQEKAFARFLTSRNPRFVLFTPQQKFHGIRHVVSTNYMYGVQATDIAAAQEILQCY